MQRSISRESWAELVQVSSEVPAQDDPPWGRVGHSRNRQESRILPPRRPWTELPGAGGREVHREKILDCPRAPCSPWLCDPRPGAPTDPEKEAAAPWGDRGPDWRSSPRPGTAIPSGHWPAACVPSPELEAGAIMVQNHPQLWAKWPGRKVGSWGGWGAVCGALHSGQEPGTLLLSARAGSASGGRC